MSIDKNKLILLVIVIFFLIPFFTLIYNKFYIGRLFSEKPILKDIEAGKIDINSLSDKQKAILVKEKADNELERIKKKDPGEFQKNGYTHREVQYVINPELAAKRELGLDPATSVKASLYTQEEIDEMIKR